MNNSSQHNYLTTDLDPKILSTPFKKLTNWIVITGATCSGKTTLIDQLSKMGFKTVPEVARKYYSNHGKKLNIGHDLEQLKRLSRGLTTILLETERNLNPNDFLFLDRAFPDQLTYYRILGIDPNEILQNCFYHHYAGVLFLDRLTYKRDDVRYEEEKTAEFLSKWHARDYMALGYKLINVPAIPLDDRINFVFEKLS